jgi:hypothetical protein
MPVRRAGPSGHDCIVVAARAVSGAAMTAAMPARLAKAVRREIEGMVALRLDRTSRF